MYVEKIFGCRVALQELEGTAPEGAWPVIQEVVRVLRDVQRGVLQLERRLRVEDAKTDDELEAEEA